MRTWGFTALLIALAAAGCGGDSGSGSGSTSETTGAATSNDDPRILVAALGDSITSGSPGYDPDPAARANIGFGEDQQSTYEFWAEKANPELAFRNCGVFGERTEEIAARFDVCLGEDAEALIVQGGINDIAQGGSVDEAAANLRAMVVKGKERGIPVAITDVLPWTNGFPRADAPIRELNKLIAAIGADEQVPVLPFYETLDDQQRPGRFGPGLTAEGDHPSVEGYRRLGEKAVPVAGFGRP